MNIGIIGSGRIGSTVGKLWVQAGHQVMFSSRHPERLQDLTTRLGQGAQAGSVRDAAQFGDVLLLSVPWMNVEDALTAAAPLDGKVLIDTTNQLTSSGLQTFPGGISAAEFNSRRAKGARLVKAYNTLTAGFLAQAAGLTGPKRVVMPFVGEDTDAKRTAAMLIADSGFDPFDVGGWEMAKYIEPPRRAGAFYGEEWHLDSAQDLLARLTGSSTA